MATKPEIIAALDLPALIQEIIPTCRPAGKELSGLCPFHKDQAASLSVNPTTGVYLSLPKDQRDTMTGRNGKGRGKPSVSYTVNPAIFETETLGQ